MILDIEIRGVVSEHWISDNRCIKYQMRRLICQRQDDFIRGGHFYTEEKWTEWEDIPIVEGNK